MTEQMPAGANGLPSWGSTGEELPAAASHQASFPSDNFSAAQPSAEPDPSASATAEGGDALAPRRRRRRRGGRGRRRSGAPADEGALDGDAPSRDEGAADAAAPSEDSAPEAAADAAPSLDADALAALDARGAEGEPRRRRRGRRGRGRGRLAGAAAVPELPELGGGPVEPLPLIEDPEPIEDDVPAAGAAAAQGAPASDEPRRRRRRGRGRERLRDGAGEDALPAGDATAPVAAADQEPSAGFRRAPAASADETEGEGEGGGRRRRRGRGRARGRSGAGAATPAGPVGVEAIPGEDDDLPTREPAAPAERERKRGAPRAAARDDARPAVKPGRKNVILVNASDREETRVAVVEDGQIADFQMHVKRHETLVNDIYRGKVVNLEPAIGAAFIDFGEGRNGFLHTSDVLSAYGEEDWSLDKLLTHQIDPDEWDEKASQPDVTEELTEPRAPRTPLARTVEPDEHRAQADGEPEGDEAELVEVAEAPPVAPAAVLEVKAPPEEPRALHHGHGHGPKPHGRHRARPRLPISELLEKGQSVVVQVTKDAIGDKGPTLTTYISIPGRYLVLMPSMARTGVSRKIEDEKERRRLKRILESLDVPAGMGVIVRTAGIGCTREDLKRDLDYLMLLWDSFGKRLNLGRGPAPLYEESDVAIRTIRDLFNDHTEAVVVDDEKVYQRVREFMEKLIPEKLDRVQLHSGPKPLFHAHNVEQDFERIFARRIDLPSGGSIVFDQAEALVAIDVNSGKTRTDGFEFEDVALRTNLDAVTEIARQIRLRDLGGIIVCDFIDMQRNSGRRSVERALRDAMAGDRARSKLGRLSQFGLLELTRQRLGPGLSKMLFHNCPRCRGSGRIRTVESRTGAILRRLGSALTLKGFTKVEVRTQPEVVEYLRRNYGQELRELQVRHEREVELIGATDQLEDSVLRYLRTDGREVRPGGRRKR